MQENDIIEPSSSPWASPIVLVHLKSGYWQVEIHPEDREKQHSLPARTMAVQSHAVRALQCASYFRAPDGDRAKGSDFLKLFTWMTS
ncbi:hypothetical protein TNCV_4294371 [Trichonephila clavipes]|uniref:Reverse transcriptase n=1 Tax=Trichonephila clavipes TaxID=2585209 RepID=A0A8X6RSM7_TRICX|nr:hypothetical protein TNCV_4294371 [Trichonephila clavipes]